MLSPGVDRATFGYVALIPRGQAGDTAALQLLRDRRHERFVAFLPRLSVATLQPPGLHNWLLIPVITEPAPGAGLSIGRA